MYKKLNSPALQPSALIRVPESVLISGQRDEDGAVHELEEVT